MAQFSSSYHSLLLPWTLLVLGTLISRGNSAVPPPDYANTKQVVHRAEGEYQVASRGSNDITIRPDSTGHNNPSPKKAQRLTSNDTSCPGDSRFNGNICPVSSVAPIQQIFPNDCRQCSLGTTAAISRIPGYFLACVDNVIRFYPCSEQGLPHCTSAVAQISALEAIAKSDPELLKFSTKLTVPCEPGKSAKVQNRVQPTVPTVTMTTGSLSSQPKQTAGQYGNDEKENPTGESNDAEGSHCFLENNLQPHNTDCNKFQICLHGKWIGKSCQFGAYFNPTSKICETTKDIVCHPFQTSANSTKDSLHRSKREIEETSNDYDVASNKVAEVLRRSKGFKIPPFGANIVSRRPHPEYCTKFIEYDGHRYFTKTCGPETVYLPYIFACGWPRDLGKILDRHDCKAYRYCSRGKYYSGRCPHGHSFDPFKQACSSGFRCPPTYPVRQRPLPPSTTQAPPPPPRTHAPRRPTTTYAPKPPPTTTMPHTTPAPTTTTTYATTTTTPEPTTTPKSEPDYNGILVGGRGGVENIGERRKKSLSYADNSEIASVCYPGVRIAAHPRYCNKFIECDQTGIFVKKCGPGTVFLPHLKVCGWPKDYVEPVHNRCGAFYTCDYGYKVARQCAYNYSFDFETRACSQRYRCSDYYSGRDQEQDIDA